LVSIFTGLKSDPCPHALVRVCSVIVLKISSQSSAAENACSNEEENWKRLNKGTGSGCACRQHGPA